MPPSFADLGVPEELCKVLARRGIAEPFPIQAATLPDALAGRDICGRAPTGSGKTLAFGLTIATRSRKGTSKQPTTLVLVPTRELATQVAGELAGLGGHHRLQVATLFGGTGYGKQREALRKGASIVVACPGRLEDLVQQGDLRLDNVDLVVLDEADRMADMGFLPAVKRLLDRTSAKRQTLLFSATLDNDVDVLIKRYQNNPARHEVVADEDETGDVTHEFWPVDRAERVDLTAALVRQHGRVVVFCRTRHGADRLTKQLAKIGVDSRAVHGSRSQSQRERALEAFTRGKVGALVATDVAARGIHVDDVACVVHFDIPADHKDYVHRSGRTGRAGRDGSVVSMVLSDQRKVVRGLQKAVGLPQELTTPELSPELLVAGPPVQLRNEPSSAGRPGGKRPGQYRSGGPRRSGPPRSNGAGNGNGRRSSNGAARNGNGPGARNGAGRPHRTNGSGSRPQGGGNHRKAPARRA